MKSIQITRSEMALQFVILIIGVWAMGWAAIHFNTAKGGFDIYYDYARGEMPDGWVYKDYAKYLFYPFLVFNQTTAMLIFGGMQIASFMVLTHYLFKVKYGWVTIVAVLPFYKSILQCGNIDIILAMAYIFPPLAVLGILVKPHHIIFSLVHAVKSSYGLRWRT